MTGRRSSPKLRRPGTLPLKTTTGNANTRPRATSRCARRPAVPGEECADGGPSADRRWSRLKILEAFAAGLPVISTRIGAEGLNVEDGVHLTVVEDIEGMAPEIVASLKNPTPGLAQAERGRRLVEGEYDWQILADRFDKIWERTGECGPGSRPRRENEPGKHALV